MASSLGYSILGENNLSKNKNNNTKKPIPSSTKVNSMIKLLHNDDEDNLADFKPPSVPESSGVEKTKAKESMPSHVSKEAFGQLHPENEINDIQEINYPQSYPPPQYYQQATTNIQASNEPVLQEKLQYLIQLIEENNDSKVNSITEELVLYCFLGVFVIFITDSFTKMGKYIR